MMIVISISDAVSARESVDIHTWETACAKYPVSSSSINIPLDDVVHEIGEFLCDVLKAYRRRMSIRTSGVTRSPSTSSETKK